MKLILRKDLGGYGQALASIDYIDGVEITKPFVLIAGENGAGKSTLLNMIRASVGLSGNRTGRVDEFKRPIGVDEAGGDLGKLAAFTNNFRKESSLPDNHPGLVDVRELGWVGQRTFFFDSQATGKLLSAPSFDDHDFQYHVGLIVGARHASHGQSLGQGWDEAIRWALGAIEYDDIYDAAESNDARAALFSEVCPGPRPSEKWLFIDEPETAIDAGRLFTGLATFIQTAAEGKLRVFCASHSPLFAAGLADHPNVQVVDMGGPKPWLAIQRRVLEFSRDPVKVSRTAAGIVAAVEKQRVESVTRQEKEREGLIRRSVSRITEPQIRALVRLGEAEGSCVEMERGSSSEEAPFISLAKRKLAQRGFRRRYELTELGSAALTFLRDEGRVRPDEYPQELPGPTGP